MSTGMQATWYIPRPFKIIPSYWLILGGLSRAKCTCKTIHKKESLISVSTSFNTLVLFYLDQEIHQISKLRILVYFSTASRSLFSLPSSFLPALAGGFFIAVPPGKPIKLVFELKWNYIKNSH